jgi:DNA modification methylase
MLGDCRDRLAELPDDSVDAVVCDPPYGLSKEPDIAEVLGHWLAGDDYEHDGNGFMGNSWDSFVPGPVVWKEVFRVLKPGGHLLAFAGSRTADIMGIAIRLAGFEMRDTIAFMYGSGLPKSLNVGKALDARHYGEWRKANPDEKTKVSELKRRRRAALAEAVEAKSNKRPRVAARLEAQAAKIKAQIETLEDGQRVRCGAKRARVSTTSNVAGRPTKNGDSPDYGGVAHNDASMLAAATAEAQRWAGWGTALKPAHEPIICARKPLEGTVADNVLKHGTGALNIEASRVGFASEADEHESKAKNRHADFGSGPRQNHVYGDMSQNTRAAAGNYDPPGRWPANVVFSHTPLCVRLGEREVKTNGHWAQAKVTGYGKHLGGGTAEYNGPGYRPASETVETWECAQGCPVRAVDEQGNGASRFFKVFSAPEAEHVELTSDAPFLYTTKPGRREKDAGIEAVGEEDGGETKRRNQHPTVKSIELMRWLCKLVTKTAAESQDNQPGIVLDPFMGSGGTGCAAVLEGLRFIGIERAAEYMSIAEKRIAHWAQQAGTPLLLTQEAEEKAA